MQQVLYFYDGWTVGKPVALPSVIRPPARRPCGSRLAACLYSTEQGRGPLKTYSDYRRRSSHGPSAKYDTSWDSDKCAKLPSALQWAPGPWAEAVTMSSKLSRLVRSRAARSAALDSCGRRSCSTSSSTSSFYQKTKITNKQLDVDTLYLLDKYSRCVNIFWPTKIFLSYNYNINVLFTQKYFESVKTIFVILISGTTQLQCRSQGSWSTGGTTTRRTPSPSWRRRSRPGWPTWSWSWGCCPRRCSASRSARRSSQTTSPASSRLLFIVNKHATNVWRGCTILNFRWTLLPVLF